jgi:hypothetical protein
MSDELEQLKEELSDHVQEITNLIETMPSKGLTSEECQKALLMNRIKSLDAAITGIEEDDLDVRVIPETLSRGNVVRTTEGRKKVICKDCDNTEGLELVCENPHDDGDFSYLCFGQWCRCSS